MKRLLLTRGREAVKAGLGIFLVLLGTNCCFLGAVTGAFASSRHVDCCSTRAGGASHSERAESRFPGQTSHCGHASSEPGKSPAGTAGCTTMSGAVPAPTVKIVATVPHGPAIAPVAETRTSLSMAESGLAPSTENPPLWLRAPASFQGRAPPTV